MEPPNRWFNPVVWLFGGRTGLLGRFYTPTLLEEADERYYALARRSTELDMKREDAERTRDRLERDTRRLWTAGKRAQARQRAEQLRATELDIRRTAIMQRMIANEMVAVDEVRAGNVLDESVMFRARALTERFSATPPAMLQAVLARIELLNDADLATKEALDDAYRDEERRLTEAAAAETVAEVERADEVDAMLEALGLHVLDDLEAAPRVPMSAPGDMVGSSANRSND